MQLVDANKEQEIVPLFRLAFRPFFLFSALFSVTALSLWGLVWFGQLALTPYGNWFWWHGHEMLFGFAGAVIVGFLLTAIQNWSGRLGLRSYPLMALFAVWLLGRIMLLFPDYFPSLLIAIVDVSFLPLAAAVLGFFVVRGRLWRNMVFIPVLLILATLNGFMHWAAVNNDLLLYKKLASVVVFAIVFLISLISGRVIPMFTANGTNTEKATPIKWLEITALFSVLLLALGALFSVNATIMGFVCLLAFVSHLIRALRWRIWITLHVPLLWSLHIACLFIALGFLQLALFYWGFITDYVSVLHTLTVGGIALTILAMIARISLGHTARKLNVGPLMVFAFGALIGATLLRAILPLLMPSAPSTLVYGGSIVLWVLSFGAFIIVYLPILTKARVDGQLG